MKKDIAIKITYFAMGSCLLYMCLFNINAWAQPLNYEWTQHSGGGQTERGKAIARDTDGNVISGGLYDSNLDFDPPNQLDTSLTFGFGNSIYLVKNDFYGNYIWGKHIRSINQSASLGLYDIATDSDDNIYLSGTYTQAFDVDPSDSQTVILNATGNRDSFLAKYDKEGNYLWSITLNGTGWAQNDIRAIEIDQYNQVYIAGNFELVVDFDPSSSTQAVSGSSNSTFVAKSDSKGNYLDMHYFYSPGPNDSYIRDIAVDTNENVYITGSLINNYFQLNGGQPLSPYLSAVGFDDIMLIKLNANLDVSWAHSMGSSGMEEPFGIALDDSANVLITGGISGPIDMDPRPNDTLMLQKVATSNFGTFIAKYDSAGIIQWAKEFGGTSNFGRSIDTDQFGNSYVIYTMSGTSLLNPGVNNLSLTAPGSAIAIITLNPQGLAIQGTLINGVPYSMAQAQLDVDALGNLGVTSRFSGTVDFDSSPTGVASYTAVNYSDAFANIYSPCALNVDTVLGGYNFDLCVGDTLTQTISPAFANNVQWSNGDSGFQTQFTHEGTYFVTLDSVCRFYFYINSVENIVHDNMHACDAYQWPVNNTLDTQSVTYVDTVSSTTQCDTTFYLHLSIHSSDSSSHTVHACNTYTWPVNGQTYTQSGTYIDSNLNQNGCDSLQYLFLTVDTIASSITYETACDSFMWSVTQQTYYQTGQYIDTLTATHGCDSMVYLYLTIHPTQVIIDTVNASNSYTWINGTTYTSSNNTDQVSYTSSTGCDSIHQLQLTIHIVDTAVIQTGPLLTATANSATFQWVKCPNFDVLPGDTNASFTASQNGSYAVIVTQNGYTDTSDCFLVTTLGTSSIPSNSSISIYPNPSPEQVHVTINSPSSKEVHLRIYRLNGQLQYQQILPPHQTTHTLDITVLDWPAGMYILELSDDRSQKRKAFMVE